MNDYRHESVHINVETLLVT